MTTLEYTLDHSLTDKARSFITAAIGRSYDTREVRLQGDVLTAVINEDVDSASFASTMTKLIYVSRSINQDVLFVNSVETTYSADPMPALLDSGDVIRIGPGLFLFQGTFWKVFQALHEKIKKLATAYDAREQEYPALWPVDLFRKINYFKDFPQQVLLTEGVRNQFAAREQFANAYDNRNDFDAIEIDDRLAPAHMGLQPAVCDVCYYTLQNARDYQNTVYTTYNKVFRNETSTRDALDRLLAFSVRDIMFVGDADFVADIRQSLTDDLSSLLTNLELDCRIETANDPFFTNDSAIKGAFQNASKLKHELLARLPYCDDDLAVGSINLHLDYFGRAFDIQLPDGSPASSGCIGIGFERLAFALYCQYGPDIDRWPESLRGYLEI